MKLNKMSAFVISLDFELFWGVTDSRTVDNYGANIEGVWQAIPAMLSLFKKYGVHATWATVGMLMCNNYRQWLDIKPAVIPTYRRESASTYSVAALARDFPKLFFARPLVEQILATDGQELASHTYSHFYCGEPGTVKEQFTADLACAQVIFNECGVKPTSLVFPRNQVCDEYLDLLSDAGFTAYRGNQEHWLYRDGHLVPFGSAGRLIRVADAYLPLTGNHIAQWPKRLSTGKLINIPASRFLRPSSGYDVFDQIHLNRVKHGMLKAAKTNGLYHLWWHPHNFGQRTDANLNNLEKILKYYRILNQENGMNSLTMKELNAQCKKI